MIVVLRISTILDLLVVHLANVVYQVHKQIHRIVIRLLEFACAKKMSRENVVES